MGAKRPLPLVLLAIVNAAAHQETERVTEGSPIAAKCLLESQGYT